MQLTVITENSSRLFRKLWQRGDICCEQAHALLYCSLFFRKYRPFEFRRLSDTLSHIPLWVLSWIKHVTAICSSRVRMNTWPRITKSRRKSIQISKNERKQAVLGLKKWEPWTFGVYRGGESSGRLRFRAKTGIWLVWLWNIGCVFWVFGQGISSF